MYWCFLYVVCKPRLGSVCSYFYTDTAVFERLRLNFVRLTHSLTHSCARLKSGLKSLVQSL